MKIYLGADHRGFQLKNEILEFLKRENFQPEIEIEDLGSHSHDPADDFPVYAGRVAEKVVESGGIDGGILICGSGQGMCMASNRCPGIRAGLARDEKEAEMIRRHNDSNVLCLSADQLNGQPEKWQKIVKIWLVQPFDAEERLIRRNQMLDQRVEVNSE